MTYTNIDIIRLRDEMSIEELREINQKCKEQFGYVSFRKLFITMGFTHLFNNIWTRYR